MNAGNRADPTLPTEIFTEESHGENWSQKEMQVSFSSSIHIQGVYFWLPIYICLHIPLSLCFYKFLDINYSFKFLQSSLHCHFSTTMVAGPAPRVVWLHFTLAPFPELNTCLHFCASSWSLFDGFSQCVWVSISPLHYLKGGYTPWEGNASPKLKGSVSKMGAMSFFFDAKQPGSNWTDQVTWIYF